MEKKLTDIEMKTRNRKIAIEKLKEALDLVFGSENVFQVGDSEFSVYFGLSPNGEPMFVNYKPTVKIYKDSRTDKKLMKAYNGKDAAEKYQAQLADNKDAKEEKMKLKKEKIARDQKARERQKEEREKIRQQKEEERKKRELGVKPEKKLIGIKRE